jgi:GMP synthase-like glutamine amidotransferase
LLPALSAVGCAVERVVTVGGKLPPTSLDGYDALVVMGGDMFVSEADRYPFIEIEQRLFREAVQSGIPAIGICLGAQILASALGGRLTRELPTQIGWDVVRFDADGDGITGALAPQATLFEWHAESFELPESAVLLGSSDAIPVQAFRAASAWAFQFHLEVETRHIRSWSDSAGGRQELEALGVPNPMGEEAFGERLRQQIAVADHVFAAFARLVGSR